VLVVIYYQNLFLDKKGFIEPMSEGRAVGPDCFAIVWVDYGRVSGRLRILTNYVNAPDAQQIMKIERAL
jgi:hypothetical protein